MRLTFINSLNIINNIVMLLSNFACHPYIFCCNKISFLTLGEYALHFSEVIQHTMYSTAVVHLFAFRLYPVFGQTKFVVSIFLFERRMKLSKQLTLQIAFFDAKCHKFLEVHFPKIHCHLY